MKDPSPSLLPSSSSLPKTKSIGVVFLFGYVLGLLSSFLTPQATLNTPKQAPQPPPLPTPPPHDLFRFRTRCSPRIRHERVLETIFEKLYSNSSPYTNFPTSETSSLLLPLPSRLRGWGSRNRVFADLISSLRPETIIELGTFLGASALHMASVTRNVSLPDSLIICLDDFRGWPGSQTKFARDLPRARNGDSLLLQQFMLNVAASGESRRVVPVPFSTASALAALCEWGVYGDLIEVDAGHDFHSAWADVNMAYAVLSPGGVMFGHDYFTVADDRGVRRAVNLFAKVKGLKVSANGEHWVLSPKPHSN